jgi:lipid-binding SYLF domain-containing protein
VAVPFIQSCFFHPALFIPLVIVQEESGFEGARRAATLYDSAKQFDIRMEGSPMKKVLIALLVFCCATAALASDRQDDVERLDNGAMILNEIMAAPDKGIPAEIMDNAKCIAVVPNMLKAAFGIGGAYGKGVTSCRNDNGWSAPAFFSLKGGSFGFQLGGQAADIIMLVMNERGMNGLMASKVKLGADASVAAGPVGRHADASTDWKLRAEVLTYSRTRGLFAGISLNGAVISQRKNDTRAFYGHMVPFRTILLGQIPSPNGAEKWQTALLRYAGK